MRKSHKILLLILTLIAVCAFTLTGCAKVGQDIVKNSGFENLDQNNAPLEWTTYESEGTDASFSRNSVATGSVDSEKHGKTYMSVEISGSAGVAYYTQKVKLYAGQTYEFSVAYKVDKSISLESGKNNAVGAYFGFLEDSEFLTLTTTDTKDSAWVYRTVYIKPTVTANYTLVCGIGREDLGGATGKVSFDNISIKAIKASDVPAGNYVEQISPTYKLDQNVGYGIAYTVVFTIAGVALLLGAYYVIRVIKKSGSYNEMLEGDEISNNTNDGDNSKPPKTPFKEKFTKQNLKKAFTSPLALFIYVLTSAFAFRFLFLLVTGGMADKLGYIGDLALDMASDGFKVGMSGELILPTGYLYYVYLVGMFADTMAIASNSIGMTMLLRIPNVVADIVICYLIFTLLSKHYGYKVSAIFAGIYGVCPIFFTMSTTYGDPFSISLAFVIGMLMFMMNKNHIGAISMYTLSILFSYDMIILLPLVVAYDVYYIVKDKKNILPIVLTSLGAIAVIYLTALPFTISFMSGENPNQGIFMVFTRFFDYFDSNVLITNNTFNFYAIFGLASTGVSLGIKICTLIIMTLFAIVGGYYYARSRNRLDFIYLASMSFIVWTVFGLGASMQNFVSGIALLLIYAAIKDERRIYVAFSILATTIFVNIAVTLTYSGYITMFPTDEAGFKAFYYLDPTLIIGSIISVITTIYLMYVGYDIMIKGQESDIKPMVDNYFVATRENIRDYFTRIKLNFKRLFKR